jgi:hypothetical protein
MPRLRILGTLPPRHICLCVAVVSLKNNCFLVFVILPTLLEEVIFTSLRIVLPLIYRTGIKPPEVITVGLQVENGTPGLSNARQV